MGKHIKYSEIEGEIWMPIPHYEGIYEVSSIGRVKSLPKQRGRIYLNYACILHPKKHRDGYLCVKLSKNKVTKDFMVHRLVALAFLPNENNLREIDHIDMNKENNRLENLQWVTSAENKQRMVRMDKHHRTNLTMEQVREIRTMHRKSPYKKITELYGIKKSAIGYIFNNKTYKE